MLQIGVVTARGGKDRPSCAFLLSIRITFFVPADAPPWAERPVKSAGRAQRASTIGRVVSYMRFAKGLKVALYGADTRGSVSSVRGCY